MQLSIKEIEIIQLIKGNPDLTKDAIINRLGGSTKIRLQSLLSINAISYQGFFDDNGIFQNHGTFAITPAGHMLLEDYLYEHKQLQKAKWEDRAWKFVPIIISLIALIKSFSVEINSILQMLQ